MPKKYADAVRSYARECFRKNYSAAEAVRVMSKIERLAEFDLPTERTVQNWYEEFGKQETPEFWTLEDTPNEDAQIVLRHFKRACELAAKNGLPMPVFSKTLAERLIIVHKAAPGIPLALAYIIANEYFDTHNPYWHLLLATQAWESEDATNQFYALARNFFGPPVGENHQELHQRYPLGSTQFYLFRE